MKYFFLTLKAIFIKDMVTELRAKQVLPTMIVLGMLIVWIMRVASEAMTAELSLMGSVALWIAFLFSGLLAQERSFASEQPNDCICGLLLAPVDVGTIYLAKLTVNITMLCLFEVIIVPMVILAFKITIHGYWLALFLVLALGNLAISSVGTIFSAIVQLTRTRGSLLSIIVLAILLPVMIPATFAMMFIFDAISPELAGTGAMAFTGTLNDAMASIAAFDAIFAVAGWWLFGFVIKE